MPVNFPSSPKDFTNKELREALRFCEQLQAEGKPVTSVEFANHFRCSIARANMLRKAAVWAAKVKAKGI